MLHNHHIDIRDSSHPILPRLIPIHQVPSVPEVDLYQEKEMLEELTNVLYNALNERNTDILAKLWHDDDTVLFCAGDGNMTRG